MEQENQVQSTGSLSVISFILAILSFFITTFVFSGIAILLGALEPKKTGLTYAGIIIGCISFFIDILIIASYM